MTNIYLGIDYGRAHLGLALADGPLATPLPPHPNNQSLFAHLSILLSRHQVTHIVLGLPTGALVPEIQAFAKKLQNNFSLPVIFHDETLSSHEASRQLAVLGVSRRKKKHEHSYAAALILEDYLESVKLNPCLKN